LFLVLRFEIKICMSSTHQGGRIVEKERERIYNIVCDSISLSVGEIYDSLGLSSQLISIAVGHVIY
jgi:hypothetical protein